MERKDKNDKKNNVIIKGLSVNTEQVHETVEYFPNQELDIHTKIKAARYMDIWMEK